MKTVEVALGLKEEIVNGLNQGKFYRDGGIIRNGENGRIVALLRDVDIPMEQETAPIIHNSQSFHFQLPNVVMGYQFKEISKRLEAIEYSLKQVSDEVRESKERIEALHIKFDADMFSNVIGPIEKAQIALEEKRDKKLIDYRDELIHAEGAFQLVLNKYINSDIDKKFKFYPEEIAGYSTGILLCIVAIRDLSIILNETNTAEQYSKKLINKAKIIQNVLDKIISNPSSLFWLSDIHRTVVIQHRQNIKKLQSQEEQVKILAQQEYGFKKLVEYIYSK